MSASFLLSRVVLVPGMEAIAWSTLFASLPYGFVPNDSELSCGAQRRPLEPAVSQHLLAPRSSADAAHGVLQRLAPRVFGSSLAFAWRRIRVLR